MAEEKQVSFIFDSYNRNKNVFGLSLLHDDLYDSNMMRFKTDTSRLETCYPLDSSRIEITRFEGRLLVWDMNSTIYRAVSKFNVEKEKQGQIHMLIMYIEECGMLGNETLFKVLPFKFDLFNATNEQVDTMIQISIQAAANPQEGDQN